MIERGIGIVLALLFTVFAGEAWAWTPYGTVERVTRIADVALTTPDGEPLFLGYKTSTVYFIGGVLVRDDGYVLGLQREPRHYVDLPPRELVASFQKQGKLPDPLPPYHLGLFDYLKGFSLWLVAVPLAAAYLSARLAIRFGRRHRRRHRLARY